MKQDCSISGKKGGKTLSVESVIYRTADSESIGRELLCVKEICRVGNGDQKYVSMFSFGSPDIQFG